MATDTLEIFGTEYSGVTGIKATDSNSGTKTYIRPQGTKSISANGTGIDVAEYASVDVSVSGSSPTIQSLTVNPSTTQQTFNASGVDGYKPVTVNAMPTGTAGTPTATKGTVSNHSVSVTPSVTNQTGYITGSTKTGTAVTVSASELVSGSETKTENGTYDVTNLAEVVVNVSGGQTTEIIIPEQTITTTSSSTEVQVPVVNKPIVAGEEYIITVDGISVTAMAQSLYGGIWLYYIQDQVAIEQYNEVYFYTNSSYIGTHTVKVEKVSGGGSGGLVYETGTLTLSSDESTPIVSFTNTHTDVPIYINITDVTETLATDNSNLYWTFMNWYTLNDSFIKTTSSSNMYGRYQYGWKTSSGALAGNIDCTNTGTGSGSLYYLVAEDRFGPYCGGTSRYWRAGRTYKWIAVWKPTA